MARNILAERNIESLRSIAASGALLAFDFDGTLSPTHSASSAARMREETAELFRSLAHAAPVAVVTGRAVRDVTPRLEGAAVLAVIGNHGAEPSRFAKRATREVEAWLPQLADALTTVPGVVIEAKGASVSVHYGQSGDPQYAIAAIEAAAPALVHKVTLVHGIGLVNLIPKGAPNKGDAVAGLLRTHGLPGVLFVGDEPTDEPAFRVAAQPQSLGVRVGRLAASAATHYIETQADIDALLAELLIGCTRPQRTRSQPHREG